MFYLSTLLQGQNIQTLHFERSGVTTAQCYSQVWWNGSVWGGWDYTRVREELALGSHRAVTLLPYLP